MQRFKCHKVVEAAEIVGYDMEGSGKGQFGVWFGPHHEWLPVEPGFFARGVPSKGDYVVRYLPDGYISWSPKSAFEDGYSAEVA